MSTKLTKELAASQRVRATNYIGTYFDQTTKTFVTNITNYPLSMPSGTDLYGAKEETAETRAMWEVTGISAFPWQGYPGQGIASPTGPVSPITKKKVIGMVVYRPAAQLGEEYGYMETDRGGTRGKFTELVFDMKHDAWVIPQLSHGIILIVEGKNSGEPAVPVRIVEDKTGTTGQ